MYSVMYIPVGTELSYHYYIVRRSPAASYMPTKAKRTKRAWPIMAHINSEL